jgi:enoyl-CoA hydratase/carnithine racemase
MTEHVVIEKSKGILTLTLARSEKKNALTNAMYGKLADALEAAETDPDARVILIRGQGDMFTSGNDVGEFAAIAAGGARGEQHVGRFLRALVQSSRPLIAAVQGRAVGIGTTMLLHCDLVYAADTAKFSLPFAQLGLCPEAASSLLLPRIAGYQAAAEKLLLGEAFDAQEALRMGFVNRLLPAAEVDAFALQQAHKLAALPASSLRVTKALMKRASQHEIHTQISEEGVHFAKMLLAPEAQEAFKAFFEKRKPDFRSFS